MRNIDVIIKTINMSAIPDTIAENKNTIGIKTELHHGFALIEPKIKPLVEVLNSWDGVKTFSSCEGHEGTNEPHVTFTCYNVDSLKKILSELKNTSWKIILNDWATTEGGFHYTLRYAPIGFYTDSEDLKETQGEISEIVELLSKKSFKPATIENKFPALKCKACGEERFTIETISSFDLSYHYRSRLPQIEMDKGSNIIFECWECYEQLELEDTLSKFMDLLNKADIE